MYAHVPYFNERARPRWSLGACLRDWTRANLTVHTFGSSLISAIICFVVDDKKAAVLQKVNARPFRVLPFIGKLAVIRAIVDVSFYGIHRLLHTRPLYGALHKYHHTHYTTALPTNFHFTATDLLLEAFVPLFIGMRFVEGVLGMPSSMLEVYLFTGYIQWFEIASHSGKEVPTVSYFPPLAPIYAHEAALGPECDARNVAFHDQHHGLVRCNYGITQWMDMLLGTRRMPGDGDDRKKTKKVVAGGAEAVEIEMQ